MSVVGLPLEGDELGWCFRIAVEVEAGVVGGCGYGSRMIVWFVEGEVFVGEGCFMA